MIQALPVPECPPAPPYYAPWRTAAGDLLEAWRAADTARLGPALDRMAGICRMFAGGEDDDRRELMEGIVEEMRRALARQRRDPAHPLEGAGLWDHLLAHLIALPATSPNPLM